MTKPKNTPYPTVEAALIACSGNLSAAARLLGITRQSLLSWLRRYPELRTIATNEADIISDIAEAHLIALVLAGERDACHYWLEAKRPDAWHRHTRT